MEREIEVLAMSKTNKQLEAEYSSVLQKALAHFAGPAFRDEVNDAKLAFFQPLSVPEESSPQFESRMSQFFDWYFFTRPMIGFRQTPLECLFLTRELRFEPEEIVLIDHMRQHRHSLFEFVKMKGSTLVLLDLLKNQKILIENPNFGFELNSHEIFEARLVPNDKNWIFMRGFCFHPAEARKYIMTQVKMHRKDPDMSQQELMLRLVKMNMRTEQYKHVAIQKIYSDEPRTKE